MIEKRRGEGRRKEGREGTGRERPMNDTFCGHEGCIGRSEKA